MNNFFCLCMVMMSASFGMVACEKEKSNKKQTAYIAATSENDKDSLDAKSSDKDEEDKKNSKEDAELEDIEEDSGTSDVGQKNDDKDSLAEESKEDDKPKETPVPNTKLDWDGKKIIGTATMTLVPME